MIYKITIKYMPRNNFAKAEVGMSIEISSKQLSSFFGNYINPFKVQNNDDIKAIRNAFLNKYGVDLCDEGILNYSSDKYLKCEPLG